MKLAVLIEDSLSAGGGFNQALNAVVEIASLAPGRFDWVLWTTREDNQASLSTLGLQARVVRLGWRDRWLAWLELSQFGRRLSARLGLLGTLERAMRDDRTDAVYFVSPSVLALSLKHLNYITTVWDLCHRDLPEFPEVRAASEFQAREWLYRNSLTRALVILTDSPQLSEKLHARYGVDRDRLLSMPFGPSPLLAEAISAPRDEVLKRYQLRPGFFFYPAQFWAHKNHVRVVQALALLRDRGVGIDVVFCGGDKGNRSYVESVCAELRVSDSVRFLGFVPSVDMRALYEACCAVVMPTYFGPTNLPPLEAWAMGKPLIYSRQCAEQAGDAALLVDPDDAQALADAMQQIVKPTRVMDWSERGRARLQELNAAREEAVAELAHRLDQFALRRQCGVEARR